MLSSFIFVSSSLLSVIFLFAASAVLRLALGDTEQQETLAAKEGVVYIAFIFVHRRGIFSG